MAVYSVRFDQYRYNVKFYYKSGFMLFCSVGIGFGALLSGHFLISGLFIFSSVVAYSVSKAFWDKILFDEKFKKERVHLFISNFIGFLSGFGYWLFFIGVFIYLYFFVFDGLYDRVMKKSEAE